jgi:hypothetical protein
VLDLALGGAAYGTAGIFSYLVASDTFLVKLCRRVKALVWQLKLSPLGLHLNISAKAPRKHALL